MKLTFIVAAALAAPAAIGTALPIGTHHDETLHGTSTASTLAPRQLFPPVGTTWTGKTQCVMTNSSQRYPIWGVLPVWRIVMYCDIRHNKEYTKIYELCMEEADDEGLSWEEKYLRCEGFKGFGK